MHIGVQSESKKLKEAAQRELDSVRNSMDGAKERVPLGDLPTAGRSGPHGLHAAPESES